MARLTSRVRSGIDILFVCTGNICRSPMAEAMLARQLADLGVAARVHSAGLLHDGEPAPEHGIGVLADRSLDISGHRSRRLTWALVSRADLIVGMARRHVREAAAMAPEAWPRSFTLKELVRRGEEVGSRAERSFQEWLAQVHAGRKAADMMGDDDTDDIFDPIGGSRKTYDTTAQEIDRLVARLSELAFAPVPFRAERAG